MPEVARVAGHCFNVSQEEAGEAESCEVPVNKVCRQ